MKKILKTIACCLGALAIAFTAFFVPKTKKSASADSSQVSIFYNNTEFNTFFIPFASAYSSASSNLNAPFDSYDFTSLNVSLNLGSFSLNGFNFTIKSDAYFRDNQGNIVTNSYTKTFPFVNSVNGISETIVNTFHSTAYFNYQFIVYPGDMSNGGRPSLDFKSLEVGYYSSFLSNVDSDYFGFPSSLFASNDNFIIYSFTDTNNWRFVFSFRSNITFNESIGYKYDKFYNFNSVNFSDNEIFQNGYDAGYNLGLDEGTTEGYNNGYSTGYDVGFGNGRNEGIQNANNYSFLGLFGAMIDAPLIGLRSLFNFEFLGINLLSFITSLLTIALITFVIKKLMGR